MIKRFLFVEDGTVDVDDLELDDDTKVIVYRQNSTPPVIFELKEDARTSYESCYEKNQAEIKQLHWLLNKLCESITLENAREVAEEYCSKYL